MCGHGLQISARAPSREGGFQRPKQSPDSLSHRRNQVARTSIRVNFWSQERLAQAVAAGNGSDGETDLCTRPTGFMTPYVLPQELTSEAAGEAKF